MTQDIYTVYTRTVRFSLPGHYSTYVLSAGEVACYQAKALVINSTLLAGLLIVVVCYQSERSHL